MKKSIIPIILLVLMMIYASTLGISAESAGSDALDLDCAGAILMEASTGKVLYEKNADTPLPPASVTKIMTLLLVMESIDAGKLKWTDTVTASAYAASMGGSQIFLKEGEQMTVEDLVKSVVVASANDAAVALAEHISGSESAFVSRMNERAKELGMTNTHFENTNGLDDTATDHVTSARDIALMSRELLKHRKILDYTGIWTDTVRNGTFGLTNTNRLIRFYSGATGLKTGSTAKAKFCISATAKRDGMELIAVVLAAPSRDVRNNIAKTMLDWGYANFSVYTPQLTLPQSVAVSGGHEEVCAISADGFSAVIPKASGEKVEISIDLPERIAAPVTVGSRIGSVTFTLNGKVVGETPIIAAETVEGMSYLDALGKIFAYFLGK